MPITPTYPGVYIEELPSGVRTIAGVATSIAAFVGWASQGPADLAGLVLSWPDYERQYGGLDPRSLLGYAVYHFFLNGGQQAYIVRLTGNNAAVASTSLDGVMTVSAKNPGEWGNRYAVSIKRRTDAAGRFQLSIVIPVEGVRPTVVEAFENLSMSAADSRFVEGVVNGTSQLVNVTVTGDDPAAPTDDPASGPLRSLTGGADGPVLSPGDSAFIDGVNAATSKQLARVDLFNILCVPGETDATTIQALQQFCRDRRAFLVVDAGESDTLSTLQNGPAGITGDNAINSALYFPWVSAPDPMQENRQRAFPPSGFVAGLYAKTDAARGVWKAPAGVDVTLVGAAGLMATLTDQENGVLNVQAVNCLRTFPVYGLVVWGSRTLRGNNEVGSEWKYVPVRRLALFLEESLYRGTKWVVFEPNDHSLWGQIRLNIGAFMQSLFRQGAFQGSTPREAYFVKCDAETTTQHDINLGIVNIVVGFAPLKPAEFVIIKIQQMAGQTGA
jgi:phage tail sheath protein FI